MKGDCLNQLGNVDQALEAFQTIIRASRKNVWELLALICSSGLHRSRNEIDRTQEDLKKVLETFPDHPLCLFAALQLGTLHFKKNNLGEASTYYSMILKGKVPELLGPVYFGFGEIFIHEGKDEKALNSFQTAIEHLKADSPWFFLAQMEIGNLQRKFKKYEEAKSAYRIILDQSKDEGIKKAAYDLLNYLESH
jgi:tetratricopeptide (TPR) repeat protein